jgi:hypothetical protein
MSQISTPKRHPSSLSAFEKAYEYRYVIKPELYPEVRHYAALDD